MKTLFVIKVARNDKKGKYKAFEDASQAEPFWVRLIKRSVLAVEQQGGAAKVEMFNADETCPEAAQEAVISGKAEIVKSSKISAPRNLKGRATTFGAVVDAKVIKKAQKAIDDHKGDFLEWARADIAELYEFLKALKDGGGDNKEILNRAFKVAYQITGRGGAFGYKLITRIGDHLCKVIRELDGVSLTDIAAIQVHVDGLKVVITQQLEGDGGLIGEEVIRGLNEVLGKIINEKANNGDSA